MGEYYFHLDQLTVGYNGKPLIDQIQVGIHKGEIAYNTALARFARAPKNCIPFAIGCADTQQAMP